MTADPFEALTRTVIERGSISIEDFVALIKLVGGLSDAIACLDADLDELQAAFEALPDRDRIEAAISDLESRMDELRGED